MLNGRLKGCVRATLPLYRVHSGGRLRGCTAERLG